MRLRIVRSEKFSPDGALRSHPLPYENRYFPGYKLYCGLYTKFHPNPNKHNYTHSQYYGIWYKC